MVVEWIEAARMKLVCGWAWAQLDGAPTSGTARLDKR
jgi:hypothetical protein